MGWETYKCPFCGKLIHTRENCTCKEFTELDVQTEFQWNYYVRNFYVYSSGLNVIPINNERDIAMIPGDRLDYYRTTVNKFAIEFDFNKALDSISDFIVEFGITQTAAHDILYKNQFLKKIERRF